MIVFEILTLVYHKSMKLSITVVTRAKRNKIEQIDPQSYKIWVSAPPEHGKANDKIIALLAKHLGIAKSRLSLVSGSKNRQKIIEII